MRTLYHKLAFMITGLKKYFGPQSFGAAEIARLAEKMPEKKITICQDETFHPNIYLVAIEPVSDFILLEK